MVYSIHLSFAVLFFALCLDSLALSPSRAFPLRNAVKAGSQRASTSTSTTTSSRSSSSSSSSKGKVRRFDIMVLNADTDTIVSPFDPAESSVDNDRDDLDDYEVIIS